MRAPDVEAPASGPADPAQGVQQNEPWHSAANAKRPQAHSVSHLNDAGDRTRFVELKDKLAERVYTSHQITVPASQQRTAGDKRATAVFEPKAWATLQARAALMGVSLVRTTDDRDFEVFVASRWSLTRQLDSVGEVEHFLRRIGGSRP